VFHEGHLVLLGKKYIVLENETSDFDIHILHILRGWEMMELVHRRVHWQDLVMTIKLRVLLVS